MSYDLLYFWRTIRSKLPDAYAVMHVVLAASGIAYVVLFMWLGAIRFVPAADAGDFVRHFTGLASLAFFALLCWPLVIPGWLDAFGDRVLGVLRKPPATYKRDVPVGRSGWVPVIVFISPLVPWFGFTALVVLWFPMATVLMDSRTTNQDFTIGRLNQEYRMADYISLPDRLPLGGSVYRVPHNIWQHAKPGDTIRLNGTGNRWGVFYDEIELIKQQ